MNKEELIDSELEKTIKELDSSTRKLFVTVSLIQYGGIVLFAIAMYLLLR